MIKIEMEALPKSPLDELETFAFELSKYLLENHDQVVLIQSEPIRAALEKYKLDLKYSVYQHRYAKAMNAYTVAVESILLSNSEILQPGLLDVRRIVAQEAFEKALCSPQNSVLRDKAKSSFCELNAQAAPESWEALECYIHSGLEDTGKRLKAHTDFIDAIFVDPIIDEFMTDAIFIIDPKGRDGYYCRTYQLVPLYMTWGWQAEKHFQYLPTLQEKFNLFRCNMSDALLRQQHAEIKSWLEDHRPREAEKKGGTARVVENQGERNEKILLMIICLMLVLVLTMSLKRERGQPDDSSENGGYVVPLPHVCAVLGLSAIIWAAKNHREIWVQARETMESVRNTMQLSGHQAENNALAYRIAAHTL